jgi:glycosyltransferase involved in cell wall biosynthesis
MIFVGPEDKGTQSLVEKLGLEPIVKNTGRVSYEDSLEYISSASVCMLVESALEEGIFLPSKLIDYLVARKPVLALSPQVGVVSDLVRHKGIVRVDSDDDEAIEAAISNYYMAFKECKMDLLSPSEHLVRKFEPKTVGQEFLQHVNEVLSPM